MAEVVCGDCGHSFKPGKAPGLAGAAGAAAGLVADLLGAVARTVPGAIVGGLVGMFGGSSVKPAPDTDDGALDAAATAAADGGRRRRNPCLSCQWPCFWRCPVRGPTILF